MRHNYSISTFKMFFLSLISAFHYDVPVGLFIFILFGVHLASRMFFNTFGMFSVIICLNFSPFSLLSSGTPIMCTLVHLMVHHVSPRLGTFFFIISLLSLSICKLAESPAISNLLSLPSKFLICCYTF